MNLCKEPSGHGLLGRQVGMIYLSFRIAAFFIRDALTVEVSERRVWLAVSYGHPTLVLVKARGF